MNTHKNEFQNVEKLKQNIRTIRTISENQQQEPWRLGSRNHSVWFCMCQCRVPYRTSAVFCWFLLSS